MNDFSHRTDADLRQAGLAAAAILLIDLDYPLDEAQRLALGAASTDFEEALAKAGVAHDAAVAANTAKDAMRASLLAALGVVSSRLYAPDSGVDETMLLRAGFAPRRPSTTRPKAARTVTGLTATPDARGGVLVEFERSGNPRTAIFQVLARGEENGPWAIVAAGSRTRLRLEGFPPGRAAWLSVVATTSLGAARPSPSVGIYLVDESASRRRAA